MLKKIEFETILPIWRDHLWPGRKSQIEPVSAINSEGLINLTIQGYKPHFFGIYENHELIGVNSCHRTSLKEMRSRGLWVHPQHRHRGVGSRLLLQVFAQAKEDKASRIWTMARQSSAEFYLRLGFSAYKETSQYEFGPHVFCEHLVS